MALIISDELLSDIQISADDLRVELAIWLFQSERVSLGKAAKIANLSRFSFQNLLAERTIPVINYSIEEVKQELETQLAF
jgi:predicted HTH domain antitoxin